MLIKRTERLAQRGGLSAFAAFAGQADRGVDRRTFLRRSGLLAGGLGALGTLPLSGVRKAKAGPPPGAAGGPACALRTLPSGNVPSAASEPATRPERRRKVRRSRPPLD